MDDKPGTSRLLRLSTFRRDFLDGLSRTAEYNLRQSDPNFPKIIRVGRLAYIDREDGLRYLESLKAAS